MNLTLGLHCVAELTNLFGTKTNYRLVEKARPSNRLPINKLKVFLAVSLVSQLLNTRIGLHVESTVVVELVIKIGEQKYNKD